MNTTPRALGAGVVSLSSRSLLSYQNIMLANTCICSQNTFIWNTKLHHKTQYHNYLRNSQISVIIIWALPRCSSSTYRSICKRWCQVGLRSNPHPSRARMLSSSRRQNTLGRSTPAVLTVSFLNEIKIVYRSLKSKNAMLAKSHEKFLQKSQGNSTLLNHSMVIS